MQQKYKKRSKFAKQWNNTIMILVLGYESNFLSEYKRFQLMQDLLVLIGTAE